MAAVTLATTGAATLATIGTTLAGAALAAAATTLAGAAFAATGATFAGATFAGIDFVAAVLACALFPAVCLAKALAVSFCSKVSISGVEVDVAYMLILPCLIFKRGAFIGEKP